MGAGGVLWCVVLVGLVGPAACSSPTNQSLVAKNLDAVVFGDPFVTIGGETLFVLSARETNLPIQALWDIHTRTNVLAIMLYSESAPMSDDGLWQIPTTISALSHLMALVAHNGLRGTLPSQLATLTTLSYFASTRDQISGTIPSQLSALTNLRQLVISGTVLSSSIPPDLQALTNCLDLELRALHLTGTVASQLALMTALRSFSVADNALSGPMPSQLATLNLRLLTFANNTGVSGSIPAQWGALTGLESLDVSETDLEGPVPSELGNLGALTRLELQHTRLSGPLPSQLGRLVRLTDLDFSSSLVSGLPSEIARATALRVLSGAGAALAGDLPSGIGALLALERVTLQANALTGPLPPELGLATALTVLELSYNRLQGTVPSELGLLTGLVSLGLAGNALEGAVPSQLALLTSLQALALADNRLAGTLPRQLFQHLTALTSVSLARNSFSGLLPHGAASGVWGKECEDTGLDNTQCPNECDSCPSPRVRLKDCDATGAGDWCVHVAWLVGLAVAVAVCAALGFVATTHGRAWHEVAKSTVLSLYAACELFVDALFVANASPAIFPWAVFLLVLSGVGAMVLTVHTLRQARLTPPALALGCLLGTLDVSVLDRIIPSIDAPPFMAQSIIFVRCLEAVGEGMLQAISLFTKPSTITALAFSMSVVSVMSLAAVGSVIALTRRYHTASIFTSTASVELSTHPFGMGGASSSKPSLGAPKDPDQAGDGGRDDGNDGNVGNGGSGGRGGGEGRKARWCPRWLRAMLALAPVVALLGGAGVGSGPAETALMITPVAPEPLHRVPRPAPVVRSLNKATLPECGSGFDISDAFVCIFGEVWAIADVSGTLTQLENVFPAIPCAEIVILPLFDAVLPSQIGLLQRLQVLMLGLVHNTVLPSELGLLSRLQHLALISSDAEALPTQLGRLGELRSLHLNTVPVSSIPSELGLAPLELLSFFETGPTALPSEVASLPSLIFVVLRPGRHPLPSELGRAQFRRFEFQFATGSGRLPSQLALVTSLSALNVRYSQLTGDLGEILKHLTLLTSVEARSNRFHGTIPSGVSRALRRLDLAFNSLGGTLPSQLALATLLTAVTLQDNRFTGTLPTQLGALTLLTELNLRDNAFHGPLPPSLVQLQALAVLDLRGNKLSGVVPPEFALLPATVRVRVEHNALSGTLPPQMSDVQRDEWLEACDYSGLDHKQCARDCRACAFDQILVKHCDARGFNKHCLSLYWVLAVSAVGALAMRVWVSTLGGAKASNWQVVVSSVLSTLVTVHQFLLLFFLLEVEGAVRALGIAALFVALAARYLLTVDEFVKNGHHDTINTRHKLFGLAVVFCVMDPFTLMVVSTRKLNTRHDRASAVRLLKWCAAAALVEDLPMLVLQVVVITTDDSPPGIAYQALVATALSVLSVLREWVVHTAAFSEAMGALQKTTSAARLRAKSHAVPPVPDQVEGSDKGEERERAAHQS